MALPPDPASPTTTSAPSTTTSTAADTTTAPAADPESSTSEPGSLSTTEPAPEPTEVPRSLRIGDKGPAVEQLQAALEVLGFRPGVADGDFGSSTASAVLAFQKFEDIGRDGIAGPVVLEHLVAPTGTPPRWSGSGPHIEVDLDRQIVLVWTGDRPRPTILNASTGSGGTYVGSGGSQSRAITPTGEFVVERRIDGIRESYLGLLYRPMYFHGGYAIHGSNSVPAYPASHGCVRVSNADQDWLFGEIADGTTVSIA